MSWFEEQIKTRKQSEEDQFARSAAELRAAVTRKKMGLSDDPSARIKGALDEILVYYGITPRELPEKLRNVDEKIEYACHPHGIMRRSVRLTGKWYKNAIGAMFCTLKTGELVALLPGKLGGYSYLDPSTGNRVKINRKTQKQLDENAICFYRPFPLKKLNIRHLSAFMLKSISPASIVSINLATLAVILIGLFSPQITKLLFSVVIQENELRLLLSLAALSVSVTVSGLLMGSIRMLLLDRINTEVDIAVSAAAMGRLLSLPARFFTDYSAGNLSTRLDNISHLCSSIISAILSTGLVSLFSLIYINQIFVYANALVLPALSIIGTTFLFTVISMFVSFRYARERMELQAKERGMSYALISGVQKLRLSGSEKRAFTRWMKLYAKNARLTYSLPAFLLLNKTISLFITLAGTAIMYFFAVKSGITSSDYYAFTISYGAVSGAFVSLSGLANTIADIKPTWDLAKPILETLPEIGKDKKAVTNLSGEIELNNVSFRYDESMPNIVDGLSLKIRRGQYVAIVGKTGCGKSTLVRLLLGFEKPQKGAIYYDGHDLESLDLRSVRRKIGSVTQNARLFHGDFYSNIVICAPWLTLDDAWRAAEISGIADDIRALPMGMHTLISEGSGGVSGGQKQRLMIARAVAPKPNILILDEATSALDNITQKKISEALAQLKCTRIVIAHRLSTIRQCDRIIVLDGGKIIEDGTYDELIAQNGFFAELVERQRLDVPD